jgi:hypothetical protein
MPSIPQRCAIASLLAVVASSSAAMAQPAATSPAACAEEANRVAGLLGISIDHASAKGDEHFLQSKDNVELRFACPTGNQRFPRFFLTFKAAYPPKAYWNVVTDAGVALTGASARRVRLAAHKCHKAAVNAANKQAVVRQYGLGIDCHVALGSAGMTSVALRRRVSPPR